MNLALDSFLFSQEYPEKLTRRIAWGTSVCVKFSPNGDYIASGLSNGAVVIIDFDTLCAIRVMRRHVAAIQCFSWTQEGRYLLSASRDYKCILWDVATGEPKQIIQLEAPVWNVVLHPNELKFVAALYESDAVLVDMTGEKTVIHPLPSKTDNQRKSNTLSVTMHPSGDYAITATNRGEVNLIDLRSMDLVHTSSAGRSAITYIVLSPSGKRILLNCQDRVIRLCDLPDISTPPEEWSIDVALKFDDVVNRRAWSSIGFSSSEDFVGATVVLGHDIVLWETELATLQKIYEGPKEELFAMEFHPKRSIIMAVGVDTGRVYLFEPESRQRWSALAPDFVELEDNIDYSEQEDEFDIYDEEQIQQLREAEDEHVDIVTPLDTDQSIRSQFVIPISLTPVISHASDGEAE